MRQRKSNTASAKAKPAAAPKNRFERFPRLTLIAVVLVLLAASVAAVEWSLTFIHDRLDLNLTDRAGQDRVLRLRESAPGRIKVYAAPENRYNDPIGPVDREYELRIDKEGFIWPSIVHDKPDLEIAFLGGSTTESLYVRPTMRFPHLAGRMLEARTGLKINSLNAGKSGNNSMHAVLDYLGKVAPRRPRFVVLMEAVNDIGLLNRKKTYWNDDKSLSLVVPERALKGWRPVETFVQRLRDRTIPYTYRLVRRGSDRLARSLERRPPPRPPAPRAAPQAAPQATPGLPTKAAVTAPSKAAIRRRKRFRASYEPALRSFVRLAKAWGSEPVLMTQVRIKASQGSRADDFLSPEELRKGDFNPASFASIHDYANAIIRRVAMTEGAILIDLVSARRWTREDVYDGLHFTETGSRHVAEIIEQDLAPLILRSQAGKQRDSRLPDDGLAERRQAK